MPTPSRRRTPKPLPPPEPKPPARARSEEKRTYLSRDQRRQTLIDVAADIVEREGWAALSMSALAERGGTSRQLVYLHFANLEELLAATAWAIFNETMEKTQASVSANPTDLVQAVRAAEAVTLDLRPGRGDALWQLIAGTAAGGPELDRVRRQLRSLITKVWAEPLRQHLGMEEEAARVYAWMLVMSFWGLRQLIRDRKVSRERGMELFAEMVSRLLRP